jgi:hypothetical protein
MLNLPDSHFVPLNADCVMKFKYIREINSIIISPTYGQKTNSLHKALHISSMPNGRLVCINNKEAIEMKEEMKEEMMEGMMEWWEHLPDDKKKAVVKAKMDMKMKKLQAKMDFLKEMQKIFG